VGAQGLAVARQEPTTELHTCSFIEVLICISSMANGVKHVFGCILLICESSSGKQLLITFAYVLIRVPFFLLNFERTLYVDVVVLYSLHACVYVLPLLTYSLGFKL
jgi:hypothetical protein